MIAKRLSSVVLAGTLCLAMDLSSAAAQDAGAAASDCSLLCSILGRKEAPVQQPVAAAPAVERDADVQPKAKIRAKPKPTPVVIAAGEPEAASTTALAAGLRGHPVKIVKTSAPAKLRTADLLVEPLAAPAAGKAASLFREDLHVIGRGGCRHARGPRGPDRQSRRRRQPRPGHRPARARDAPHHGQGSSARPRQCARWSRERRHRRRGHRRAAAVCPPQGSSRRRASPGDGILVGRRRRGPHAVRHSLRAPIRACPGAPIRRPLSVNAAAVANPQSAHPREAAVVLAALNARARKTLASARPCERNAVRRAVATMTLA